MQSKTYSNSTSSNFHCCPTSTAGQGNFQNPSTLFLSPLAHKQFIPVMGNIKNLWLKTERKVMIMVMVIIMVIIMVILDLNYSWYMIPDLCAKFCHSSIIRSVSRTTCPWWGYFEDIDGSWQENWRTWSSLTSWIRLGDQKEDTMKVLCQTNRQILLKFL